MHPTKHPHTSALIKQDVWIQLGPNRVFIHVLRNIFFRSQVVHKPPQYKNQRRIVKWCYEFLNIFSKDNEWLILRLSRDHTQINRIVLYLQHWIITKVLLWIVLIPKNGCWLRSSNFVQFIPTGESDGPDNYRPVRLKSIVYKLMECILKMFTTNNITTHSALLHV